MRTLAALFAAAAVTLTPDRADTRSDVAARVMKLTRASSWRRVAAVPIRFRTFHPQGMVKIGDTLFVSSVEATVPTKRLTSPAGDIDRDAGEGIGHLFKLDMMGNLLGDLRLGEGAVYHPGVRPSSDSEIKIEVWLPAPSAWNGKFMAVGNGGQAARSTTTRWGCRCRSGMPSPPPIPVTRGRSPTAVMRWGIRRR